MFDKIFGKKKETIPPHPINTDTDSKITSESIRSIFSKNSDIVFREIYIGGNKDLTVTLVYFDGMTDSRAISDAVIFPLMHNELLAAAKTEKDAINLIEHGCVYYPAQRTRKNLSEAIIDITSGGCGLIFDEENIALTFETKGFEHRAISEPTEENITKGPKDVFVESLRVNTATIRRRFKTDKLIIEQTTVGRQTQTSVAIVYVDGIANEDLIKEVKSRLDSIDVDGILETCTIEEYIIDGEICTFPLITSTERPDVFSRNIIAGRVGIIVDGIPIAFNAPAVISQFLRAPDDYSQPAIIASMIRLLRYSLMLISVFLPAFYVSITTFHHEMIPSELALSIASSKEGVPYPAFVEVLLMLIAFETLTESGLRLPKSIGQAVSIVGALVVGEAAVNAKFISPAVVVIIAITAISGFAMPNQDFANSLRTWRFIMVIFASILGIIGITFGAILLVFAMSKIETFGVPYLSPYAANDGKNLEDSIIRLPLKLLKFRPSYLKPSNKRRQK